MAGVLEYLAFELLELASNKASEEKTKIRGLKSIQPRHIMLAVKSDLEFNRFLKGAEFAMSGRLPVLMANSSSNKKKKGQIESDSEEEMVVEQVDSD